MAGDRRRETACRAWKLTQLKSLGSDAQGVAKLSRADMAACMATGGTGATTVAATMIAAHVWRVFRGFCHRWYWRRASRVPKTARSISQPTCKKLAHTPVTVVAAGAKAILDRGQRRWRSSRRWVFRSSPTDRTEFPAFWSANLGPTPHRCEWTARHDIAKRPRHCACALDLARRAVGRQSDPGGRIRFRPMNLPPSSAAASGRCGHTP